MDLLFFDTTSTYFETEQANEAMPRDQNGRRCKPAPAGRWHEPASTPLTKIITTEVSTV